MYAHTYAHVFHNRICFIAVVSACEKWQLSSIVWPRRTRRIHMNPSMNPSSSEEKQQTCRGQVSGWLPPPFPLGSRCRLELHWWWLLACWFWFGWSWTMTHFVKGTVLFFHEKRIYPPVHIIFDFFSHQLCGLFEYPGVVSAAGTSADCLPCSCAALCYSLVGGLFPFNEKDMFGIPVVIHVCYWPLPVF